MLTGTNTATINALFYRGTSNGDALRVELVDSHDTYVVDIPNGDFAIDNPALMFMAYCGVLPSNLQDAVGSDVPITWTPTMEVTIHPTVFSIGQSILNKSSLFS